MRRTLEVRHTRETLAALLVSRGISADAAMRTSGAVFLCDTDKTYAPDRAWMRAILSGNTRAIDRLVERSRDALSRGVAMDLRCETGEFLH